LLDVAGPVSLSFDFIGIELFGFESVQVTER